ncbi:hypothetical protein LOTGIDRAFT_156562 [Lottia gigantea]|uniref:EGF-like domain-containing protein n=1 Tax=Lottia gigantea TaxID=225164 RepID=V4AIN5_LOTGI|nr:hypothetical protein LOTGIDRAFT_156562 [Lottia gigantea]ESP03959.1 hypothetical protein LOTGIDRAFT_156562 [Lottia gigantea]
MAARQEEITLHIFDDESKQTSYHPKGGFKGQVTQKEMLVGKQFYVMFNSSSVLSTGAFDLFYSLIQSDSCELNRRDPCTDVECNGAACTNGVCECPEGYSGTMCESLIDPCSTLECPSPSTCWNPDYPFIQPTCVCPDYKVRSDSGCKELSYDFDLFINSELQNTQVNLPESEYIYIDMTKGLTIILWVACLDVNIHKEIFYLRGVNGEKVVTLTSTYFNVQSSPSLDLNDFRLDNKQWNHIAIAVSSTGRVEIIVNYRELEEHDIALGQSHGYVRIGHDFVGYISRLRLWNRFLFHSEITSTINDPDDISNTDLIFNWKDIPSSRYQTRIFPSRLQDTSKPIYLCENRVYHEACEIKIIKMNKTELDFCPEREFEVFEIPIDERSVDITPIITEYPNILKVPGTHEGKFPLGTHDLVILFEEEADEHFICIIRIVVTHQTLVIIRHAKMEGEREFPTLAAICCNVVTTPSKCLKRI